MTTSMTTNWFDPNMPQDKRNKAEQIVEELGLQQMYLRIRSNEKLNLITFTQDRRVVEVPVVLLDKKAWSDIRFLFRAVLESAPSQWNMSADKNDWSAFAKHSYKSEN
jgi:hypothetical protein